ncbi:MAG: plastocyanin/azurin family copper-binding protein [Acidimicrobiia bacterium]
MRNPRSIVLLFALALVGAACGGGTTNSDAGSVPIADTTPVSVVVASTEGAAHLTDEEPVAEVEGTTEGDPSQEESEEAHDDGGAAHDDGGAAHDEGEAAHDESEAAHDEGEEAHDEGGAAHDEGEEAHDEAPVDFDREVEVSMTEFAYSPDSISVTSGETVRFVLTNDGVIEHEFRLTTEHAAEEHVASGHEGHAEGGEGGHAHGEILILVAPGTTEAINVAFDADADFDIMACLIPGHFEAGMYGDLVVEG